MAMVVERWTKVLIAFATGCAYPATLTAEAPVVTAGSFSCRMEGLGNENARACGSLSSVDDFGLWRADGCRSCAAAVDEWQDETRSPWSDPATMTLTPRARAASRGHPDRGCAHRLPRMPSASAPTPSGLSAARPADGADIDRPDGRSIIVIQEHSGGTLALGPMAHLSRQLAKISHHAATFFNPSHQFGLLVEFVIPRSAQTTGCDGLSVTFLVIGSGLLVVRLAVLAEAGRNGGTESYFLSAKGQRLDGRSDQS
jgi:hypothetical protein